MTGQTLEWTSGNTEVVTVSGGVVTIVGAGTATITVKVADTTVQATCEVTVKAAPVASSITVDDPTLALTVGDEDVALSATVKDQYGEVMTGQTLEWTSSKDEVVTVTDGVVTIVGAGTATITVKVADTTVQATCEVTVKAAPVASSITVDEPTLALTVGDEDVALSATVKDQYGAIMSGQTLEWTSDHEDVVTVNQYGVVSVVGAGTATITVKVVGTNLQATCEVTVNAAPVQEVTYSVNFADTAKWSTTTYGDGAAAVGAGQTVAIGADGTPAATDGIMTLYGGASHFYLQADANVEGYTQSWRINTLQQSNGMAARAIQIDLSAYTNAQITVKWRSGGAGGRGIALYTDEQVAAGATSSATAYMSEAYTSDDTATLRTTTFNVTSDIYYLSAQGNIVYIYEITVTASDGNITPDHTHSFTHVEAVAADCGTATDAVAEHWTCTCLDGTGFVFSAIGNNKVITTVAELTTAYEHTWADNGDGTHKCSVCGTTQAHDWGAWVTTETTHSRECSVCGATESGEHTFKNGVCTVCGRPEGAVVAATQNLHYSAADVGAAGASGGTTISDGDLFTAVWGGKNATVTQGFSTAVANDGSELTFDYAMLPSGSGGTITITAKDAVNVTIYYTATDSGFATKNQSKSGNLTWTINGGTTETSAVTENKANTTAYAETIALNAGDVAVITISGNRLALFGIYGTEIV